ncbi:MAG TPA: NUDIX domain-containing protein [Candidatus Saccharimonadales bacterium]|jgi:8-oxo-dGTP diphosphatase
MNNINLVTKCFITDDAGRVLILKRSDTARIRPGKWDLPGGIVEHKEDPNTAVLREIKEETSIDINTATIIHASTEVSPAYILTLFYSTKYYGDATAISHEHSSFEWINFDDFYNLDLPDKFKVAAKCLL